MPNWKTHIEIGLRLNEELKYDKKNLNLFLFGSILPDINNGYLITADVVASGYSKTYLAEYVRQRNMERVAQGVYMSSDVWLDEMYIIHLRNKNAVFSHESALYMHNLIYIQTPVLKKDQ